MDVISNISNDNLLYILFFSYQFCFERNLLEFCPQPSVSAVSLSNDSRTYPMHYLVYHKNKSPLLPKRGFPGGSGVKASACSAGDPGSIPESGISPGEGNGNPLQYSCLENPMEWGPWWATVHGVAKSQTQLRDFSFTSLSPQIGIYCFILSLSI